MNSLNELAKTIRFDNASKGFDPLDGGLSRYLLLVCSEICEAQNEIRDGREVTEIYFHDAHWYEHECIDCKTVVTSIFDEITKCPKCEHTINIFKTTPHLDKKPCGFPVEIADAAIRIMDIQAKLGYRVRLLNGDYEFDHRRTLDDELLAIVSTVSDCFRPETNREDKLRLALTALFLVAKNCNIDMMHVINLKLAFNRTRPPKHGRKF